MLVCGIKAMMGEATSQFSLQSHARRGCAHKKPLSPPILVHVHGLEKFQMVQQVVEQEIFLAMVQDGELVMVKRIPQLLELACQW